MTLLSSVSYGLFFCPWANFLFKKQIYFSFTGYVKGSRVWGLNVALSAVNIGEAGKDLLSRFDLARIYATAALQVKASLPERFQFLAVSKIVMPLPPIASKVFFFFVRNNTIQHIFLEYVCNESYLSQSKVPTKTFPCVSLHFA